MSIGQQLLEDYRRAIADCVEIPNSMLPSKYHNNKTGRVLISTLEKKLNREAQNQKPARSISVKFRDGQVVQATTERLAAIESYAEQIARGESLEAFNQNELKQYNFEVAFCLSLGISVEDND
jgi:hypothetical protein